MSDFGRILKTLIDLDGISIRQYSRQAGIDGGNLNKILNGNLPPPNSLGKVLALIAPLQLKDSVKAKLVHEACAHHSKLLRMRFGYE